MGRPLLTVSYLGLVATIMFRDALHNEHVARECLRLLSLVAYQHYMEPLLYGGRCFYLPIRKPPEQCLITSVLVNFLFLH